MRVLGFAIAMGALMLPQTSIAKAKSYQMTATFDKNEIAWSQKAGTSTIRGSALLRTRGGEVKTCAGYSVEIIPESTYARERMLHIFGQEESGYASRATPFSSTDDDYVNSIITSTCDAQGVFEATKLAAGTYFVTAKVTWQVPFLSYSSMTEGGMLMKKISVGISEDKKVVLTG
jgi:hypothetical protein